ncbi:MAG: hypothetical protein MZV65_48995 [Chromatiales bacterium]|nr:hypothetical protein [Chromatiales bacterium]
MAASSPSLAQDSRRSERFFGEPEAGAQVRLLRRARTAQTGEMRTVAVPGYVYWADEAVGNDPPVGFGLFRAARGGRFELWLAGLEGAARGKGHGRRDAGGAVRHDAPASATRYVRVRAREPLRRGDRARLLEQHGFTATRETPPRDLLRARDAGRARPGGK